MLIDKIRALFTADRPPEREEQSRPEVDPVHLSAAVLLLDLAYADGEFTPDERKHVEEVLERHFLLSEEEGRAVLKIAEQERSQAVDHFQFTRILRESYDTGQKMVLAEVLWGLVLADGTVSEHEHYLARKIANLLELEPGYLSTAKANAERSRSNS